MTTCNPTLYAPAPRTAIRLAPRQRIELDTCQIGGPGPQGIPGDPGVYVGPTPPLNTSLIWVDTSGLP